MRYNNDLSSLPEIRQTDPIFSIHHGDKDKINACPICQYLIEKARKEAVEIDKEKK